MLALQQPASHREELIDRNIVSGRAESGRDRAQEGSRVQDVIVKAEVARRKPMHAGGLLAGPGLPAKIGSGLQERIERKVSLPVGFNRSLELAIGADPRIA